MSASEVEIGAENHVLTVTFNRPDQRNAMTWAMYEALEQACDRADSDGDIRVMVLRGAGGRGIGCAVDLRVATPRAKFGVPIARTLWNCVSVATLDLLVKNFGHSRTIALLLTAELMSAEEGHSAGFLVALADDLEEAIKKITDGIVAHAPLSMWASKEGLRRLHRSGRDADMTDIVSRVYGSADFRNAVEAFTAKRAPSWNGHRDWTTSEGP